MFSSAQPTVLSGKKIVISQATKNIPLRVMQAFFAKILQNQQITMP